MLTRRIATGTVFECFHAHRRSCRGIRTGSSRLNPPLVPGGSDSFHSLRYIRNTHTYHSLRYIYGTHTHTPLTTIYMAHTHTPFTTIHIYDAHTHHSLRYNYGSACDIYDAHTPPAAMYIWNTHTPLTAIYIMYICICTTQHTAHSAQ